MKPISFDKYDYSLLGMVLFFTVIRLAVAPTFGLGVDEAHYFLYAKYLDLSYVDHPPLVGWVQFPLYRIFGTSEFLVRLPAILLFALTSVLCYHHTKTFSGSKRIAILAVLAVNSSFLLNAMSLMLLPDCLLLALIFPLIGVFLKIEETGGIKYFLALGILLGLSGLAKYTAVFFVVPLVVYYGLKKRFDLIFSPYMFMAALVALLMISPVFYWNYHHDFISFRYQGGHVLGSKSPSLTSFFVSLLAQFGAYSPFMFLIAFYGFFKSILSKDDRLRLSCLFGGVLFVFFLYSSLYERTLPHWPSLFYLLFIPAGIYYLASSPSRAKKNFLSFSIGFTLVITLFLYAALPGKWFTFPDYQSPYRDIYGFSDIAAQADMIMKKNSKMQKAVAVNNWTMGSRMMYYGIPYGMRTFVIDSRQDQFDVWEKEPPLGYDLLFVDTHFHHAVMNERYVCDAYEPVKSMDIVLRGGKIDSVSYIWCRNYQGMKP
ncbi:MAG: hypothetical protein CSYNP_03699 [Syntrophus sp. SKADARSKE-3]|nr:hypothetical protein [Syntrophus sp. SKADARSKE-3]